MDRHFMDGYRAPDGRYHGADGRFYTPQSTQNLRSAQNAAQRPPTDFGPEPFVVDIAKATLNNDNFRLVFWTGQHLQLTLMSLEPGEDISLEAHPHTDQFLRVESGRGLCQMGKTRDQLNFAQPVFDDTAILVPAGYWHNITNTGSTPLKLYSIYAPPNHAHGAVHPTKAVAEAEEHH
jgi:mannose-6-phosphate isomerase-like protein (cupin superfamily)